MLAILEKGSNSLETQIFVSMLTFLLFFPHTYPDLSAVNPIPYLPILCRSPGEAR